MTDRKEEQAALHALHMLDAHERQILRTEMRSDATLRELVAELENAAAQLVFLLPEENPPGEAVPLLLQEIKERRRAKAKPFTAPLRLLRNPWFAWGVAACLAVLAWRGHDLGRRDSEKILALAQGEAAARGDAGQARDANAELSRKFETARAQVVELADEVSRLQQARPIERMEAVPLRAVLRRLDEAFAAVVWDGEKQEGRLKLEKMPPAPAGRDYQLWVVDKRSQASVSAGLVKVDARGSAIVVFRPVEPLAGASKFFLSIEAQGGTAKKSADSPVIFTGP